jgi:hypothetical protein
LDCACLPDQQGGAAWCLYRQRAEGFAEQPLIVANNNLIWIVISRDLIICNLPHGPPNLDRD